MALKKFFWDYNIDSMELVNIFYGKSSKTNINRIMVYSKLLNGLSWYNIIKIIGVNESIKLLDDNVLRTIFPPSYRNSLYHAKRILSEWTLSLAGFSNEIDGKSLSNDFYLNGVTALGRFNLNHRYSDDLDFFANQDKNFKSNSENFISLIRKNFKDVEVELTTNDFVRFYINIKNIQLKIELINNVAYHYSGFLNKNCKVDNWQNILSNKISAISRNSPKDFADIQFLTLNFNFNWIEIFEQAKEKDTCVNEIEIAGIIDEFQIERLNEIKWVSEISDFTNYKIIYHKIAK